MPVTVVRPGFEGPRIPSLLDRQVDTGKKSRKLPEMVLHIHAQRVVIVWAEGPFTMRADAIGMEKIVAANLQ